MANQDEIDWERIEIDYRSGVKTLRQIAKEHSITHGAVNKRAKRDGWVRDLSEKIRAAAESKVSRSQVSTLVSKVTEREVVEAVSNNQANVRNQHMDKATVNRRILEKMIAELDTQNELREELSKLGEIMADPDARRDTLNELYHKVISFAGRVDSGKKLMEAWAKIVDVERKVFGIKDAETPQDLRSPEEILERLAYLEAKRRAAEE